MFHNVFTGFTDFICRPVIRRTKYFFQKIPRQFSASCNMAPPLVFLSKLFSVDKQTYEGKKHF